jgi:hypothetical protein
MNNKTNIRLLGNLGQDKIQLDFNLDAITEDLVFSVKKCLLLLGRQFTILIISIKMFSLTIK